MTEIILLAADDGKFSGSAIAMIVIACIMAWLGLGNRRR